MGHVRTEHGVYGRLQERLNRFPIGAPPAEALYEILKRLYSEEEAAIAARMPLRFTTLRGIARRTGKEPDALRPVLDRMADKGLVMDFERKGTVHYILSPTLLGFFEFAFMRIRDDIPQKELARYMVAYVHDQPDFAKAVFAGKVRIGRTLVHEEAVVPDDLTRVLDHERATAIVRDAKAIAVSLCLCRHVMEHEGKSCGRARDVCTSLNAAADFVVRRGFGRKVSREEALDILAATREAGLVHIGDNVRKRPAYICHCCGCCCGMLAAITRFRIFDAVVTSPFLAVPDGAACTGCGLCAARCPIGAVAIRGSGKEARAAADPERCLGCGVCVPACARKAMTMARRPERIIVPETAWHRAILMAVEQGKLENLLFDDFERRDHAVLRAIVRTVVSLPPVKKALLLRQGPSRFLKMIAG